MKIQELIRKYEELWEAHSPFHEPVPYTSMVELFLKELKQLDEPQKVKVPQFVADWLKLSKSIGRSLFGAMRVLKKDDDVEKWLQWSENQELFARAWLDGYEVEKEKRYSVKIRGEISENLLVYGLGTNRYFFARTYDSTKRNEHTRKQLEEAGFGWVFDCEGIEIEEVTE